MPPPTPRRNVREFVEETYAECEAILYYTVRKFKRKYGGNFEDLLSEAHSLYMDACTSYNPERCAFKTWVRNKIWYGLSEGLRKAAMRANRLPRQAIDLTAHTARQAPSFDRDGYLEWLGKDARVVAMLAFNPPFSVRLEAESRGGEEKPAALRYAIQKHLREEGWEWERVQKSFTEIKELV